MKRTIALLALCAGLLLTAAACSREGGESSSQVSTPSLSTVETASPTPTPTPTPSPSPSPTPAVEDPAGFEEAFGENPIDAQLEQDRNTAASMAAMQQAYNDAARRWQTVIDTAYLDAQASLSGEELSQLEQEQQDWEANLDANVQAIREENSDALTAAEEVVNFYRDRAMALCQAVYRATGELPAFPEIGDGQAEG